MRKVLLFLSMLLPVFAISQQIYPVPHHIEKSGDVNYTGIRSKAGDLLEFVTDKGVLVKERKDSEQPLEGYKIDITKKVITIFYATERGRFYAYQTLRQILRESKKTGKLPLLRIVDAPDVAFRGTVEGFYGDPWTQQDRKGQLQFYGEWKLNTYIYGPKDDPFHSSPKWREPYRKEEANQLRELVEFAKENHVDFYWAVHPGKDIKWNSEDSAAVLHKFELMYGLGVRHFAVFFDDITGEGTKADKQAGLLNYLQHEFADKKTDVGMLIMCPTEYNKAWSNPEEGTYLDILGDQLDPRIHIMWTGNTVIHDITREGQQWVNKRINRPSFVWWNFPVNDYVRNHLLLGPAYGLDKDARQEMSGFVSNPMDKPEASKVAIFSIANYSWNLNDYAPDSTWKSAIELLFPSVSQAYQLFASHNTDPGPSYHQYRRLESPKIGVILDRHVELLKAGQKNVFSSDEYEILKSEFSKFEPAAQKIMRNMPNEELVHEIRPWLAYFARQGAAASYLLEVTQSNNLDSIYQGFGNFQDAREKLIVIDQTNNRNPYQPGIVTASRHVLPWIEQSYLFYHKLLKDAGYKVKDATNQPSGGVFTNIDMLKSLPVQNQVITGNRPLQALQLSPMLEYVPFKGGDYVGINISSTSKIKDVSFKLDRKVAGFVIQYSRTGQDWFMDKVADAKYVRLLNENGEETAVKLEQFQIIFE